MKVRVIPPGVSGEQLMEGAQALARRKASRKKGGKALAARARWSRDRTVPKQEAE